jgi:hypothetical protein
MARVGSMVLGAGLVVLWIVGLNHGATLWLTWLCGVAGLTSLATAALIRSQSPGRAGWREMAPAGVGLGLLLFSIVGLALRATGWLAWWTFAFGCAYLALTGLGSGQLQGLRRRAA